MMSGVRGSSSGVRFGFRFGFGFDVGFGFDLGFRVQG
jgi:hypothetical protein